MRREKYFCLAPAAPNLRLSVAFKRERICGLYKTDFQFSASISLVLPDKKIRNEVSNLELCKSARESYVTNAPSKTSEADKTGVIHNARKHH